MIKVVKIDYSGGACPYQMEGKTEDGKWNVFGVNNIVEWQRNIVPLPPYNIRLFCETVKAFKNKKTVYRLKPMIFTYWC